MDPGIVRRTYWTAGTIFNSTSNMESTVYVGLRSIVYVNCPIRHVFIEYEPVCTVESVDWTLPSCQTMNPAVSISIADFEYM